jgi:germacradienol/geosmin synthase
VEDEGENANCVLVLERFLNVRTQLAANLTNELLTSRLYQFDNTAVTELPPLFDEHGLDPVKRMNFSFTSKDFKTGNQAVTSGTCGPAAT